MWPALLYLEPLEPLEPVLHLLWSRQENQRENLSGRPRLPGQAGPADLRVPGGRTGQGGV